MLCLTCTTRGLKITRPLRLSKYIFKSNTTRNFRKPVLLSAWYDGVLRECTFWYPLRNILYDQSVDSRIVSERILLLLGKSARTLSFLLLCCFSRLSRFWWFVFSAPNRGALWSFSRCWWVFHFYAFYSYSLTFFLQRSRGKSIIKENCFKVTPNITWYFNLSLCQINNKRQEKGGFARICY